MAVLAKGSGLMGNTGKARCTECKALLCVCEEKPQLFPTIEEQAVLTLLRTTRRPDWIRTLTDMLCEMRKE